MQIVDYMGMSSRALCIATRTSAHHRISPCKPGGWHNPVPGKVKKRKLHNTFTLSGKLLTRQSGYRRKRSSELVEVIRIELTTF